MKVKVQGKNCLKIVDLNRRRAIHETCLNCSCWDSREVTNCIFLECPLWPFRTGRGKQNPKQRMGAIRKNCLWCMAGQHSEIRKCVSTNCPLFAYRMKGLDRTQEINSNTAFAQIEPVFEAKTGQGGMA